MSLLYEIHNTRDQWSTERFGPRWAPVRLVSRGVTIGHVLWNAGIDPRHAPSLDAGWECDWKELCKTVQVHPDDAVPIGYRNRYWLLTGATYQKYEEYRSDADALDRWDWWDGFRRDWLIWIGISPPRITDPVAERERYIRDECRTRRKGTGRIGQT